MKTIVLVVLLSAALVSPARAGGHDRFVLHDTPRPIPALTFVDGDGQPRTLADFRGRVILLNVWATWCSPCRKEMPGLDRLQAALGGPDFEVVALAADRGGIEPVRRFFTETGVRQLAIYLDRSATAPQQLGAFGLPITLLIDREGRELGRLVGPAEWDAPDMVALLRSRLIDKSRVLTPAHTRITNRLTPHYRLPIAITTLLLVTKGADS